MKIREIECLNVAGVPDGTYSFMAAGRQTVNEVTLVAGVRASGKTRLLEAISHLKELVGPYGPRASTSLLLDNKATQGKLGGTFLLDETERAAAEVEQAEFRIGFELGEHGVAPEIPPSVRKLFSRYDHDPSHGKMEYFPAWRRLPPFGQQMEIGWEKLVRLGSNLDKYCSLVPSLIALSLADGASAIRESRERGVVLGIDAPDSLGPYRSVLASLMPELRLRAAATSEDGSASLLFERPDGSVVDSRHLSEGQKQSLLLGGTIMRIGLSRSIVLVDCPELHIHVADQARFFQALLALGSDNQWIVATGSSEVMKGARREQVIALAGPKAGHA